MELSSSLPVDLLALADPAARGTAPPLGFKPGEAGSGGAALPFELCLELLDPVVPSGETLPLPGNPLPAVLDDDVGLEPDSAELTAEALALALPTLLPPAPAAAALPAGAAGATSNAPAAATLAAAFVAGEPAVTATDPNATVEAHAAPAASTTVDAAVAAPADGEASWLAAMTETLAPEEQAPATKAADSRGPGAPITSTTTDALAADYAGEAALVAPRGEPSVVVRRADESSRGTARAAWRDGLAANAAQPSAAAPATDSSDAASTAAATAATPFAAVVRGDAVPTAAASAAPVIDTGAAQPANPTAHIAATPAHASPAAATAGAPIAVADHVLDQRPVDTTTPRWQEAFANRVQWLANQSVGEAHIRLNPPELGTVDVKISLVEDRTFVQLTTHTNAARDELAQSLPRLRELFATSGLELGGASVATGRDGQARYDGAPADRPQAPRQGFASAGDEPLIAPASRRVHTATSRIDLFA